IRDKLVTGVQTCALPISSTPKFTPAVVLLTVSFVMSVIVGTGSVKLMVPGSSCFTMKMDGPKETPTSTLSVTGTIQTPMRLMARSEERRVGKEGRSGGSA